MTAFWHGTSETAARAILANGVDFDAKRTNDMGDFGWGFYLSGRRERAGSYGSTLLRVTIQLGRFAFLKNPYFLEGLEEIAPETEIEHLFHRIAHKNGCMLTCTSDTVTRERVAREIRDAFVERGFAGIATPYSGDEVVVFTAIGIKSISLERK